MPPDERQKSDSELLATKSDVTGQNTQKDFNPKILASGSVDSDVVLTVRIWPRGRSKRQPPHSHFTTPLTQESIDTVEYDMFGISDS